jgi:hypothetical protein
MTQREKNIGITVGVVVVLAGGFFAVNSLFLTPRANYIQKTKADRDRLNTENALLAKSSQVNSDWNSLGIVKDDVSRVSDQVFTSVYTIASRTGLLGTGRILWNGSSNTRPIAKTDYSEVAFKLQVKGNTAEISKVLYAIETQGDPIKLDAMTISAPTPGVDSLTTELTLTALMYTPKNPTPGRGATRPSATSQASVRNKLPEPTTNEATIEEEMMKRRQQQLQQTSSPTSAPATAPALTPEQVEAEMMKKRQQQSGDSITMPAIEPMPAPASAPATNPGGVR